MSRINISVPIAVSLANESAWQARNEKRTTFFVARCHFILNVRQTKEPTAHGAKIATFQKPTGVKTRVARNVAYEISKLSLEETFSKSISEDKKTIELVSSLGGSLGIQGIASIESQIKSSLVNQFTTSFSNSFRVSRTIATIINETHDVTHEINENLDKSLVLVEAFQKYAVDVVFAYIDYLNINYDTSWFGIRKKREKYPEIRRDGMKENVIKVNKPLCCLNFWKPQMDSAIMVIEEEYRLDVEDSTLITISAPERLDINTRGFPSVPSLYQIANAAFPLNWAERQGDWTLEQLQSIEENDARTSAIRFLRNTHDKQIP